MERAKGILKVYKSELKKDNEHTKTAPLEYIIDLQYKKYLDVCFWCNETPLKKGAWLRQEIKQLD